MVRSGRGSRSTNCSPGNLHWRRGERKWVGPRAADRHAGDGHLRKKIIDALPYSLTASQQQAAAAIAEDLRQPLRMLRLLQGDVGSGKTVVAVLAGAGVCQGGA